MLIITMALSQQGKDKIQEKSIDTSCWGGLMLAILLEAYSYEDGISSMP